MDQDALVIGGRHLIDALTGHGFNIEVAFWARLSDTERWVLYLASPKVDEIGPGAAYQLIQSVLRDAPEWGIDFFSVSVLGANNPMAKAAADAVAPSAARRAFAAPRPYSGRSLGGVQVDGALIYPRWEPAANSVA